MNIDSLQQNQLVDDIVLKGFHIIDSFLSHEHVVTLQKTAHRLQQEGHYQPAKIGKQLGKTQNSAIRNDVICWLDEHLDDPSVIEYLAAIKKVSDLLNQALFLGLQEIEAHFAIYESHQFYKKHRDAFTSNNDRRISCVFYLNTHWEQDFGGELTLYNDQQDPMATLLPICNRLVIFNSNLLHEVCTAYQTRCSIATWLKVRPTVVR